MATKLKNLEPVVEALLFVYGEPLSTKKIAGLIKASPTAVNTALINLKMTLSGRGIKLIHHNDSWQLTADKSFSEFIEKLVKSEIQADLTPAGLEVLALAAYHSPVTKTQIDAVRGVNSAYALKNLILRGLVDKVVEADNKKTSRYQLSLAAFRKLGLEKKEELPMFSQLKQELIKTENILNQQI